MASQLDVVALYGDGWNSSDEHDDFETRLVNGLPKNIGLVLDYHTIDDLVREVDLLLTIDPDKPCLRSLEIWAHGNPGVINDLGTGGAINWGSRLKALKWCDVAKIYLAGCNTGLSLGAQYPAARRIPIAKSLADAMKYDPASFNVHLIVYGAAGYLTGCHSLGNTDTVTSFSESSWHAAWGWPPVWREVEVWEEFDGARAAQGDQVWNPFQNW